MTNFKFLASIFLIVSGCVVNQYQPVDAQTLSTFDFWFSFGELLTEDVLMKLTKIQLPSFSLPTLPKYELPQLPSLPQFPEIKFPDFSGFIPITIPNPDGSDIPQIIYIPNPSAAPTPAPAPAPAPAPYYHGHHGMDKNFIFPPGWPKFPSKPEHPCKCGKCLPDNVRIVVVDDCNEQKSESSESDERPIHVYQKKIKPTKCQCPRRRHHH
jgi:hypothetical protein